jgi:hypothetical protein
LEVIVVGDLAAGFDVVREGFDEGADDLADVAACLESADLQ